MKRVIFDAFLAVADLGFAAYWVHAGNYWLVAVFGILAVLMAIQTAARLESMK